MVMEVDDVDVVMQDFRFQATNEHVTFSVNQIITIGLLNIEFNTLYWRKLLEVNH